MEKLKRDAQALFGIQLSNHQLTQLMLYESELLAWNSKFNLTAIRDSEGIRTKHFLDSVSCVLAINDTPPSRLIDIGTGAGFPGIPLKIIYPNLRLTLVESVGKKAEFCRSMAAQLKLEQVEILQKRAEEVGQMAAHREKYDWAVARAVANLPTLAEFLLPLVRVGGIMLAQKGDSGPAEAQGAENSFRILGGRLRQLRKINIPGVVEDRFLVIIDKIAPTPPQYPRRVGLPSKKPIL